MDKLSEKINKAKAITLSGDPQRVGPELRKLRLMAELTQKQIAQRMDVRKATVSKIEKGSKVYLATVHRYVEALGASLRLNAHFPIDAPLSIKFCEEFNVETVHDDPFVLQNLGDELFKPKRDVVLSIKPMYSEKILEGRKTVELRRRFPVPAPNRTLAYIYSTSPIKAMVGTAAILDVLKLPVEQIWIQFESKALIERERFDKYFKGLDHGFALVFGNVKIFSRPLPLSELREKFNFKPPRSFLYATRELGKALKDEQKILSH